MIDVTYSLLYWVYPIGLLSLALSVACFIILMCSSGRRPDRDGVFPGIFNKVPIDLFLALLAGGIILLFWLIWEVWYTGEIVGAILTGILTVISVNVALGLCMSIAARIKEKTLLSNTLIWIVLKLFARFFKLLGKALSALTGAIPVIWKAVLAIICNFSIDIFLLMMAYSWDEVAFFLWSVKTALLLPFLLYGAVMLTRLEKGGKAIAQGDLSYRVSTAHMIGGFKRHGNDLNSISDGMTKAVEERLKSERMKTELITNVSHDIKTPITSIINYSSLIAEEECNCEKHREYSEVLIRKSEHLKRLLSDLVEVSKASTGNLDVEPVPCDGAVLLSQVAGEFEDLCKNASLELICSYPSTPVSIMADPKKIWRVFENLMGNACKYSLPGSRVYLSLESDGAKASFIIRNTSKAPIAATADELCSRFVRGDSSRTTEGNGLGLSIAQSLTELQGGKMDVTVDGDLFKVVITFPNI
ncbi:MAG: HAMP domain-containing histidine kinase [Ruminococcaceae bacterium]|nr:HAMP domain-containing histidine kinase [Oscillospiraceae bacterium]